MNERNEVNFKMTENAHSDSVITLISKTLMYLDRYEFSEACFFLWSKNEPRARPGEPLEAVIFAFFALFVHSK